MTVLFSNCNKVISSRCTSYSATRWVPSLWGSAREATILSPVLVPAHNRGLVFFQDVTVEFVQRHGPGDGIPHIPLLLTKIAVDVQIFIVTVALASKLFTLAIRSPSTQARPEVPRITLLLLNFPMLRLLSAHGKDHLHVFHGVQHMGLGRHKDLGTEGLL